MLSIISSNIKTINELHKINSKGKGNLIENIGKAIGDTIAGATKGGSEMVRALGLGLKDALSGAGDAGGNLIKSLGSASSEVIHTTSGGLKEVLSSITNGILIWIFILAIALFLFLKFAPFSPFAIFQIPKRLAAHNNQETQTPDFAQEAHKENHYTKQENPIQNGPANTTYQLPQPPANRPIMALYPTLAPYSPHPDHQTKVNTEIQKNQDRTYTDENSSENTPMLPKQKKTKSLDRRLKAALRTQKHLRTTNKHQGIAPIQNFGTEPQDISNPEKKKYDTVIFNVKEGNVELERKNKTNGQHQKAVTFNTSSHIE